MTEADQMRRERRELQRLLRRLLRGPVQLSQGQGGEEISVAGEGRDYPADLVRRAVSRGLAHEADRTLSATGQSGAFLRRSLLQENDAFGEQHRLATPDSVEIAGRRQTVRRNLAESPLSLLSRLKDRAGQPFLPEDALDAGGRTGCRRAPSVGFHPCPASAAHHRQPVTAAGKPGGGSCRGGRRRSPTRPLPRGSGSEEPSMRWDRNLPASP